MILASVSTWPKGLRRYLDQKYRKLLAHAKDEIQRRIEYWNPPGPHIPWSLMRAVKYQSDWDDANTSVLDLLQPILLRGWHCTRLTDSEVSDIKRNGMRLCEPALLKKRITQAHLD